MKPSVSVVLLAGGRGVRLGGPIPKQFLSLHGKPVALHSLAVFLQHPAVHHVVVVCAPEYRDYFAHLPVRFALPGARRQDSLFSGLQEVPASTTGICIHDSARPFITLPLVERLICEGHTHGAAVVGVPMTSTVKEVSAEGFVHKTLERAHLWEIQTPQFVAKALLEAGFALANAHNLTVTDDVALAELVGHPVKLILGDYANRKITTAEDWRLAQCLNTSL